MRAPSKAAMLQHNTMLIAFFVTTVVLAGFLAYFIVQESCRPENLPSSVVQQDDQDMPREYRNEAHHISIMHPAEIVVTEQVRTQEQASDQPVLVVQFTGIGTVSVYASGVRDVQSGPIGVDDTRRTDVLIGGEKAVAFDNGSGYVVERAGYRYEIVAAQADMTTKIALAQIVQSIEFLHGEL